MTDAEMKVGTKAFGIPLFGCFARCRTWKMRGLSGRRILRSGMSVGANYHAACRLRSRQEFIAKLGAGSGRDRWDVVLAWNAWPLQHSGWNRA